MSGWNDERVSLLKQLWADGLSAGKIANELGGGVSRNGVIGKVHRLGLSGRINVTSTPKRSRPRPPAIAASPVQPQPVAVPSIEKGEDDTGPVSDTVSRWAGAPQAVLDLAANQCRWPLGHPREPDFAFCPNTAIDGMPYCKLHHHVGYQPLGRARTVFVPQRRH